MMMVLVGISMMFFGKSPLECQRYMYTWNRSLELEPQSLKISPRSSTPTYFYRQIPETLFDRGTCSNVISIQQLGDVLQEPIKGELRDKFGSNTPAKYDIEVELFLQRTSRWSRHPEENFLFGAILLSLLLNSNPVFLSITSHFLLSLLLKKLHL